jgi:N-acyl-D-aspartate/D-glutamate deacylase
MSVRIQKRKHVEGVESVILGNCGITIMAIATDLGISVDCSWC